MEVKKFSKKRIGEILIEEGVAEASRITEALQIQKEEGGLIGEILVRKGWVSEENLMLALSRQLSIPFIRLSKYKVNPEAQKWVPKELALREILFPFEQNERLLSLAMVDPLNQSSLEEVGKKIPLRIQVFLAARSEIRSAIDRYYAQMN